MSLKEEIAEKRKEIRTDGYAMSISEWASLYKSGEVDIHPEFQRFYRWSDEQKTNLIESILLGIPIPPIFVSQREDGIWDVVDGLQRLSTIYQFMGILKNEDEELIDPLVLGGTKYLPSLLGKVWGDEEAPSTDNDISSDLRLAIKRSKINVSIILKESDETTKYDLFQRLNTGGSDLSEQEVRNCILVMINKDFYLWLAELAKYEYFQECISISDRSQSEAYDLELVLRFIVFSYLNDTDLDGLGDVGVYLTDKMSSIASDQNFDKQGWEKVFKETFDVLYHEMAELSFKRYDADNDKFKGGFLLSQYEVVAYGIAHNLHEGNKVENVRDKIAGIWSDERYTSWSGSGVRANTRLPRLLPLGKEIFS